MCSVGVSEGYIVSNIEWVYVIGWVTNVLATVFGNRITAQVKSIVLLDWNRGVAFLFWICIILNVLDRINTVGRRFNVSAMAEG